MADPGAALTVMFPASKSKAPIPYWAKPTGVVPAAVAVVVVLGPSVTGIFPSPLLKTSIPIPPPAVIFALLLTKTLPKTDVVGTLLGPPLYPVLIPPGSLPVLGSVAPELMVP